MLSSISTLTPRTRLACQQAAQSRVLGVAASSLLIRHRQQQTRAFRFGWWADPLDDRRDFHRRCRGLRRKYAEELGRGIPWDPSNSCESSRAFRRHAKHFWQPKRCFAYGRHGGRDPFRMPNDAAGSRPGHNIEDVERSAWGSLLFGNNDAEASAARAKQQWSSSFDDMRAYIAQRHAEMLKEAGFDDAPFGHRPAKRSPKAPEAENDYVIDPITNRKVSKSSIRSAPDESVDVPANSFKRYRSRFSASPPPSAGSQARRPTSFDGPPVMSPRTAEPVVEAMHHDDAGLQPTDAELRAYRQVPIDDITVEETAGKPVLQSEEYVREHEPNMSAASYGGASDAAPRRDSQPTQPEEPNHDELEKYKAVTDSDMVFPAEAAAAPPPYDDLHKYTPVKHNEPDGKPPGSAGPETYSDLHLYKPFMHNEPDGKPPGHVDSAPVYDPEELAKYKPFWWNEPHGQQTAPAEELGHEGYDPAELRQYKPFRWNEPDGKPTTPVEMGHEGHDPAEVQRYKPVMHNEPDGKVADTTAAAVDPSELASYGPVWHQEPDGKAEADADAAAEGLKDYDLRSNDSAETSDEVYSKILRKLKSFENLEGEESAVDSSSQDVCARPTSGKPSQDSGPGREKLESSMTRMNAEADSIDKMASLSVKSTKSRAGKAMSKAQRLQALADPYSTEPQGLETSYETERQEGQGEEPKPAYFKVHTRKADTDDAAAEAATPTTTAAATPSPSATSSPATEPYVYKILAYDPTMQNISVAETASAVPDTAQPLSPSEVLLRLSNPTKFFPYFETLQAQGFEIVSGSGDVLVFRKVRNATEPSPEAAEAAAATAPSDEQAAPVNPIDLMGTPYSYVSPSAANFASPTGYVNLDLPPLQDRPSTSDNLPPPPLSSSSSATAKSAAAAKTVFPSNIDVRREEPVFSGPKAKQQEAETAAKKPGVLKRMVVGATWVAGVSYALGVVGEYVKNM